MTDDEYNRLIGELIAGLPAGLALGRLNLALRALLNAGGDEASAVLRYVVTTYRRRDEGEQEGPPAAPPAPPRRR